MAFLAWIAVACLLVPVGCDRNRTGGRSASKWEPARFRVDGGSMAPTLFGEHARRRCGSCRLIWTVDRRRPGLDVPIPCRHCGEPLEAPGEEDSQRPAEIIEIANAPLESPDLSWLSVGELVAFHWNDGLHVKRVVGLPGDVISTNARRLFVNGLRIEERLCEELADHDLSWTLVDRDDSRSKSRWSEYDSSGNADLRWQRSDIRSWRSPSSGAAWLVYHHVSVDRGNQPAFIGDDYPFNTTLSRALNPVDRICVSANAKSFNSCELQIAFWTETGSVAVTLDISGVDSIREASRNGVRADDLPVDQKRPVALRVLRGDVELQNLSIERMIEYRLRQRDHDNYPITLTGNQCFVLGDNVPISVDSRELGPIAASQIIGRVNRFEPKDRIPGVSREVISSKTARSVR